MDNNNSNVYDDNRQNAPQRDGNASAQRETGADPYAQNPSYGQNPYAQNPYAGNPAQTDAGRIPTRRTPMRRIPMQGILTAQTDAGKTLMRRTPMRRIPMRGILTVQMGTGKTRMRKTRRMGRTRTLALRPITGRTAMHSRKHSRTRLPTDARRGRRSGPTLLRRTTLHSRKS